MEDHVLYQYADGGKLSPSFHHWLVKASIASDVYVHSEFVDLFSLQAESGNGG